MGLILLIRFSIEWPFFKTLISKPYLACMQVPNVHQLLKSVSRGENTVNKSGEKKDICMFNIINSSNPSYNIKFLKMKWKKLDCLASQIGGSKNIFCELFGDQKAENTFWLDSSSTEKVSLLSSNLELSSSVTEYYVFQTVLFLD